MLTDPIMRCLVLLCLTLATAQAAIVCNPAKLAGSYAFQLAGQTTISGKPQPTVGLGRITFDDSGKLSGTSSAMLAGFLIGNPVSGTYDAEPDCSITWSLRDDSGGLQNFKGTLSPDLTRIQFRQTDPGGLRDGIMSRTPASCNTANLQLKYDFTVSGSTTPMQPGEEARTVSAKGTIDTTREGSFQIDDDCSVTFIFTLANQPAMHMRGFLVNGGRGILAFQTDPGAMVSARLTQPSLTAQP